MLQFFSYGSGSCGNCYYLGDEKDAIIIDAGVGIRRFKRNSQEYGIPLSHIRGILITHDHADHIKAAGKISSEYNTPVYATQLVHHGLTTNYRMTNKVDTKLVRIIEPDTTFEIGPFRITPFTLPHDASQNVGYHIEYADTTFTVMTDVGDITENLNTYITKSQNIVLESNYDLDMLRTGRYPEMLKDRITRGTGHLSNDQTGKALSENFHMGIKNVWLCHLSEENNHPELARKTVKSHLESRLEEMGIADGVDFKLDVLRRRIPTGPFTL